MTGVLGDAVAKLTFDSDFQKRRQQQSASLGQGLESFAMVSSSRNTCSKLGRTAGVYVICCGGCPSNAKRNYENLTLKLVSSSECLALLSASNVLLIPSGKLVQILYPVGTIDCL